MGRAHIFEGAEPAHGSLNITESLFLALQRFRLEDEARNLWADAVCINQNDNLEKGKQVTLMGDIYRRAHNVLVWLGPGDEYSGHVISIFKQLAAQSNRYGAQRASDGSVEGGWEGLGPPTGAVKEALDNVPIEYDWTGADAFFSLPWFSRMWIIQEIALAFRAHLYLGPFDISWDDFMLAAHIEYRSVHRSTAMNLRLPYKFDKVKLLEDGIQIFKNEKRAERLLFLLLTLRSSDCTDPRDRVFAMISLRGTQDIRVVPDYTVSVTKIYTDLAREMIRKNLAFTGAIFYSAGVARRFLRKGRKALEKQNTVHDLNSLPVLKAVCKDLPSWVPDWRITENFRSFAIGRGPGTAVFAAATGFQTNVKIDPIDGSLSVVAKTLDMIKAGKDLGTKPELDYNAHREAVLLMKAFYDSQTGKFKPQNEEDNLVTFARTIIADNTQGSSTIFLRDQLSVQDLRNLWLDFACTPYIDESPTEHFETDGSDGRESGTKMQLEATNVVKAFSKLFCYRQALKSLLDDRQFAITNDGLAALVPAVAQPGDLIVLLAGAAVPLVLRAGGQGEDGRTRYYIIGDCFVHGAMYGEFKEVLKNGPWNWMMLS